MSTLTAAPAVPVAPPFARVWRIARLLVANPWTTIGFPIVILTVIFALNWAIWWVIVATVGAENAADPTLYTGALSFVFIYMLVVAVQAVNLSFPLALGYGATRRAFSLGSGLAFLLLSAGYALVMTLGAWVEQLTGGWGLEGQFFRTFTFVTDAGWFAQWWVYFCWLVFFFATGTIFAAVFVRWKAIGLTSAFLALAILVVGAIAALTLSGSWLRLWGALDALGTLGFASVLIIPAAVAAAIAHLVLRRATPRG
ncbi:hypothetical protein [Protaetiibacter larvae]|uniref:Uncharacterized protein n=1 Tax=Protaetiibacter larvae TaxID=2592654 RepID=A0A5C1Y8I0_9MICO|nr:hypothetical protein [Protaetiibacter larvae]QEO10403.1 hypothetical protein FLP23_10530 [Protaetiibacter larvae]